MSFLADENMPLPSVALLRAAGHEVASIREDSPGGSDIQVLARAVSERRMLLTLDRDFGDLIYGQGQPAPPGIVYFRFGGGILREPAERLLDILGTGEVVLEGNFTVIGRGHVRQHPLPHQR